MSITKKAISLGTTAALLASLAAVVVAPAAALASASVTSAGVVPRDGTSTGTATFTLTENSIAAFTGPGTLTVTILDSAGNATVHFSGTGTLSAPGSLGASLSVGDNSFTVTTTNQDPFNVEQIIVSGLKIKADLGAATGAIQAALTGSLAGAVLSSTATATGTLQATLGTAAATVSVNVTSTCPFDATNTDGQANFSDTSDPRNITASPGTGLQNIGFAAGTAVHNIGATVTQTVPNCSAGIGSPGTVADVVVQNAGSPANVNPGENNQDAASTWITEQTAGYIGVGTLTFTLSAGLFSASPTVTVTTGDLTLGSNVCNLSFDRTSCTVSVTAASTVASTVTLSNIMLDVASTVANGTAINVTVTASPAINVDVTANTIAYVSRVVVGTAAQPTIFINYNDQQTGLITLTEAGAGFFQGGTGANNTFALCIYTGESFTRAPYAVVTVGDLKLLNGVAAAGIGTGVLGSLYTDSYGDSCAYWTVYSASTVASTIEIRGSDSTGAMLATGALNGPRLSVPGSLPPGSTQEAILIGDHKTVLNGDGYKSALSNAVRAYKSGVLVAALSQPVIPAGTTGSAAGNITITETLNGQFKPGEWICLAIEPRTSNEYLQDTWLKTATTNDLPVITTNAASGLLVGAVTTNMDWNSPCGYTAYSDPRAVFGFQVYQQSFGTLGQITVSNLNYITTADAPNGPVLLNVYSGGFYNIGKPNVPAYDNPGVDFQSVVSNAIIGTVAKTFLDASSAKGVTTTGPFTLSTKIVKKGTYVTVMIKTTPAMAGAHVGIYIAKKGANGKWSAFSPHTGRIANGSGVVYYYYKAGSVAWLSIRGYFTGDTLHAASWSNAVQVKFTK